MDFIELRFYGVVGKRSKCLEANTASVGGAFGSENADISNDKHG